jgi:hypothetical protein
MPDPDKGTWNRIAQRFGLVYRPAGEPLEGGPRQSRYDRGVSVSPRLDQDIDELPARLAALEARLNDSGPDGQ